MTDSYSAARIHAMRTQLIKKADYERMMKMSEREIVGFLQATEYRQDIDALAIKELDDLEVIDRIIAHNAQRTYEKLRRISSPGFTAALNLILEENDAWNLKVIADAIAGGTSPAEALKRYSRKGTFDPLPLSHAKSIEELGKLIAGRLPWMNPLPQTLADFRGALHKRERLRHKPLPLTQKYFIDEMNITTLLLLKKDKLQPEHIMRHMQRGGSIPASALRDAARASDLAQALAALRTTKYGQSLAQHDSMVRTEAELHNQVLRMVRTGAISRPMRPDVLLRYIAEKDIEHENIRLLVKGKRLGLEEGFIREHLVV
jgi:vacuolar-type H+-ATPase subunit C/Vma6